MADKRSDVSKTSKCVFGVVLAAAVLTSGCAGVVMGSSASGSGAPAATPTKTPTPQPQAQAQLSATPTNASFPGVATGSSSSQTITLQNSGTANVTISSASVTGAGFSTSGLTVPMSMAPGQNTTFNVVFTPGSAGNVTGSISLLSNAPNSPLAISATGSGVISAPVLSASTGSLDFGSVLVGSSNSLGVTLTNTGNANAIVNSVLVTGSGFGASGVGGSATVPPGQTAALNITFAPSATGSVVGTLAIASNAGNISIPLAGSGGQASSRTVALNWDPSTSDVIGYYVYRMLPDGTYAKINNAPMVLTEFTDTNIQSGQTYTYVVTSVDADNVESDYSDPAIAIIP
jgi:Abnormal spindle-like microcephaly-assoc'd, ASPM-SPD-2-Hydin